jgi:hypothetical protein
VKGVGWNPGPIWTDAEIFAAIGIRSPDRPARSESLYRLRYRGPCCVHVYIQGGQTSVYLKITVQKKNMHNILNDFNYLPWYLSYNLGITDGSSLSLVSPWPWRSCAKKSDWPVTYYIVIIRCRETSWSPRTYTYIYFFVYVCVCVYVCITDVKVYSIDTRSRVTLDPFHVCITTYDGGTQATISRNS